MQTPTGFGPDVEKQGVFLQEIQLQVMVYGGTKNANTLTKVHSKYSLMNSWTKFFTTDLEVKQSHLPRTKLTKRD